MADQMETTNTPTFRERPLSELKMKNSSHEYNDDKAAAFLEKGADHRVQCGVQRYDMITK